MVPQLPSVRPLVTGNPLKDVAAILFYLSFQPFGSDLQSLQQRTWLIHWSLFIFFNHPKGRDLIIEWCLYDTKYLNAIQTTCPHILRYLATAVITNKWRKAALKDLVKLIQQVPWSNFFAAVMLRAMNSLTSKIKNCWYYQTCAQSLVIHVHAKSCSRKMWLLFCDLFIQMLSDSLEVSSSAVLHLRLSYERWSLSTKLFPVVRVRLLLWYCILSNRVASSRTWCGYQRNCAAMIEVLASWSYQGPSPVLVPLFALKFVVFLVVQSSCS